MYHEEASSKTRGAAVADETDSPLRRQIRSVPSFRATHASGSCLGPARRTPQDMRAAGGLLAICLLLCTMPSVKQQSAGICCKG
jgi:hypothetical protein